MLVAPRVLNVQSMSSTGAKLVSTADTYARPVRNPSIGGSSVGGHARAYFASDARRAILSALGLIWLLDGALQLQPFMYSNGFVEMLRDNATGQPLWLESSIKWSAHILQRDLTAWNTIFALTQIMIGLGLLYRPTVKPALVLSFAWAFIVWWFAEAFGMLFMMMAGPLTGAPGAVLLYALIGLAVWPARRPGGLLGLRGARTAWAALWLFMGWLWLEPQNSSPGAIAAAIKGAPSGMGWLSSVQHWAATAANGRGLPIALVLALLSAVIGVAVAVNWHAKPFVIVAIALNLVYWMLGQGFGGIFTGSGTDPNTAPLFILLACILYALITRQSHAVHTQTAASTAAPRVAAASER
jgi:hypothetical protein